jgi:hypothetical protein
MREQAKRNVIFFKSASRDEYRGKVLTALSLPKGLCLHTWYDMGWISNDLWAQIKSNGDKLMEVSASLIFVDSLKKPPKFYPLRKCTIYGIYVRDERAYIWLRMEEYYKYDKAKLEEFNKRLKRIFSGKLPPKPHSFAQFGDVSEICKDLELSAGLEAMEKLVKYLIEETSENFEKSVFYRFDLLEAKSKRMPKVEKIEEEPYVVLKEGKWYHIYFDYFVPDPKRFVERRALEMVKVVFNFDGEHFYAPMKILMIPSTTRISGRRIDFQCKTSGRPEINIEWADDLYNAPNPLMKTKICRSRRGIFYYILFFIGISITALPQIYEIPSEIVFLKPILSLIAGPFLTTFAVWQIKWKG